MFNTGFVVVELSECAMPRKRRRPAKFDDGEPAYYSNNYKGHLRVSYFEALDLAIAGIKDRFDQDGLKFSETIENILVKCSKQLDYTDELATLKANYNDELNWYSLMSELQCLEMSKCNFQVIDDFFTWIVNHNTIYPQLAHLAKLILVLPASNAISERSFSALRRVKSYLRSSMGQKRLNSLLLLHVHKDKLDELNYQDIIREFVCSHDYRKKRIAVAK